VFRADVLLDINISQGSVYTGLRYGKTFDALICYNELISKYPVF